MIPSPRKPTTAPPACSALTIRAFASGETFANTLARFAASLSSASLLLDDGVGAVFFKPLFGSAGAQTIQRGAEFIEDALQVRVQSLGAKPFFAANAVDGPPVLAGSFFREQLAHGGVAPLAAVIRREAHKS